MLDLNVEFDSGVLIAELSSTQWAFCRCWMDILQPDVS